jgi:hypothetical protein
MMPLCEASDVGITGGEFSGVPPAGSSAMFEGICGGNTFIIVRYLEKEGRGANWHQLVPSFSRYLRRRDLNNWSELVGLPRRIAARAGKPTLSSRLAA